MKKLIQKISIETIDGRPYLNSKNAQPTIWSDYQLSTYTISTPKHINASHIRIKTLLCGKKYPVLQLGFILCLTTRNTHITNIIMFYTQIKNCEKPFWWYWKLQNKIHQTIVIKQFYMELDRDYILTFVCAHEMFDKL